MYNHSSVGQYRHSVDEKYFIINLLQVFVISSFIRQFYHKTFHEQLYNDDVEWYWNCNIARNKYLLTKDFWRQHSNQKERERERPEECFIFRKSTFTRRWMNCN